MANQPGKPDLLELGKKLLEEGPIAARPVPRRVLMLFHGMYVAESQSALYVWEHKYYPYYYLPRDSFWPEPPRPCPLQDTENISYWTAELGDEAWSTDRVLVFAAPEVLGNKAKVFGDMVRVEFSAVDGWFEDDVPMGVRELMQISPIQDDDAMPASQTERENDGRSIFIKGRRKLISWRTHWRQQIQNNNQRSSDVQGNQQHWLSRLLPGKQEG
ncbi:hypothetical protein GGS26DRAFT_439621 [Hypomontagnella submonticulosa]|nr:hypothetical protein GGS26DRAFT_439621 [Hypomontagnella submonticulosa]